MIFSAPVPNYIPDDTFVAALAPLLDLITDRLARRSRVLWRLDALSAVLLGTGAVPAAQALLLLRLELADLLTATGLPGEGPLSSAQLHLEGYTETITRDSWRLALDVTDRRDTGAPQRWTDYPSADYLPPYDYDTNTQPARDPSFTWADFPAWLDWWGAVTWRPDNGLDRWLDLRADLTWPGYPAALEWTGT